LYRKQVGMSGCTDPNRVREPLELILYQGLEGFAAAVAVIVNEVMEIDRERFVARGPANGRKNAEHNTDRTISHCLNDLRLCGPG